jgi:hypothetical protein
MATAAPAEELKELGGLLEAGEQSAHHEAGHAVVMEWLKLRFVDGAIAENEGSAPAGQAAHLPGTYRRDYTDSAIGCAAGQAADNLREEFRGHRLFDWDNSSDNNQIRILGMLEGCLTTDDQRGWFNYVRRYAESILRIPYVWAAVDKLASRLTEPVGQWDIPAEEARRILLASKQGKAGQTEVKLKRLSARA